MEFQDRREQARKAIGAHLAWQLKLRAAARAGKCQGSPEKIGRDDCCDFGHWLIEMRAKGKMDAELESISDLHRDFHKEAGRVAGLIDQGTSDLAFEALRGETEFNDLSRVLSRKLAFWGVRQ